MVANVFIYKNKTARLSPISRNYEAEVEQGRFFATPLSTVCGVLLGSVTQDSL